MSNKMPVAAAKKIASARSKKRLFAVGLSAIMLAAAVFLAIYQNSQDDIDNVGVFGRTCSVKVSGSLKQYAPRTGALSYNVPTSQDVCMKLEIADSNTERVKGLSNRPSLSPDTGMLFVFEGEASECFWMKDMSFSIDMIFMDTNKQIIKIYHDVTPFNYPETYCADNTKYVIEVNAGVAKRNNLSEGQTLDF